MHPCSKHYSTLGRLLLIVVVVFTAQVVLVGGAAADDSEPKSEPAIVEEPLSFVVDESLEPVGGAREGVATIADSHGQRSDFASDELIVVTDDEGELERLLERRNGKILRSFDPAEYGFESLRRRYLVHIDASSVESERLLSDLEALGVEARGEHRLSSREGLGLFAVAAGETLDGMTVGLNWLAQGTTIRTRTTTEAPTATFTPYTPDAFRWTHLANGTVQDTGIAEAWNLLARAKRLPAVGVGPRIGILDRGFERFDPDVPGGSVQLSTGPNPSPCSGGNPCPFHGMNVTSTAMALVDNTFGAAGAAGPVARAIQLDNGGNIFGVDSGLISLQAAGARIINMSFSGTIPAAATAFTGGNLNVTADAVRTRGTMLVAAAGNAGADVDALDCFIACWEAGYVWPCETAGVLCVGGLGFNAKARQVSATAGSSNFAGGGNHAGSGTVDIWAPWFAVSAVDSRDPAFAMSPNTAKTFSGTSAATPVVAGVAALVLAARPAFTPPQIESTLLSTAQPGIGVASLTIDAEAAVTSTLLPNLPPDIRIAQPTNGSSVPRGFVQFRANASDREDGVPQVVRWFVDGSPTPIGQGTNVVLPTHSLGFGFHTITAEAIDSGGQSVTDADGGILVNLVNTAPSVSIGRPTNGSVYYIYRNYLQGGWTGDVIDLEGTSSDPNNSPVALPDAQVKWMRNGVVLRNGHRASVNALDLGIGTHTITFHGSDGQLSASQSVTIEVKEWKPTVWECPPLTICG